jgi:DNA-binding transcriptional MocR family regulator
MPRLSERARDLKGSPVRAMLEASLRPEVISFAGGLPAPESFTDLELPAPPRELLQYGPTEGEPELRRRIAEDLAAFGLDCPPERVLVLSGSQQGIDLVAKLLIDRGTGVAVESPAYLAALQVFRFFGARLEVLGRDEPQRGWGRRKAPALAYVTPTFQNPTGHCWSLGEREALAGACDEADVMLFEDDPYRDLAYDPCERAPICSRLRRASFVYQGSFSKTVAPGLRLGFLTASEDLFPHLVRLKQAADLHANRLSQWLVLQYLNDPGRPERLNRVVDAYRHRRDSFAASMAAHLKNVAEWRVPPGGLFFWATLGGGGDAAALLERSLPRGVLFTPGEHFLAEEGPCAAMRLNFSHASEADAERGLSILGELLREDAAIKAA